MAVKRSEITALNGERVEIERVTGKVNVGELSYTKGAQTLTTKPTRGRSAVIPLEEIKSLKPASAMASSSTNSNGNGAAPVKQRKTKTGAKVAAVKSEAGSVVVRSVATKQAAKGGGSPRCTFTGEPATRSNSTRVSWEDDDGNWHDVFALKSEVSALLRVLDPVDGDSFTDLLGNGQKATTSDVDESEDEDEEEETPIAGVATRKRGLKRAKV